MTRSEHEHEYRLVDLASFEKNGKLYQLCYVVAPDAPPHQLRASAELATSLMDCGHACAYTQPYGWVPECGCPVHDH